MVRYYGYYSNKMRGMRRRSGAENAVPALMEPDLTLGEFRKNWARLIQKIYHMDPLLCTKCQGVMKIISFIEEPDIIRKILAHLDLWETRNHDPPTEKHTQIPEMTYDYSYSKLPFADDRVQ